MEIFKKFMNAVSGTGKIANPHRIPEPSTFSKLIVGSPEDIIKQYISMRAKTKDLFQYAESTNSISDYCSALMRYAGYSTAAIYGLNLYLTNDELGVTRLVPERLNRLFYGKFLLDVADFSWVLLLFTASQYHLTKKFGEKEVFDFLQKQHIPELYWTLLFSFIVGASNADHAYICLKAEIKKIELLEPDKLNNLPSTHTRQKFDDMVRNNLIGNPNEWRLFDAKYIIDLIGLGPSAIQKMRQDILGASISKALEPEIRLHLLSSW